MAEKTEEQTNEQENEEKLRILVVDDDRQLVKGFVALLEEEKFEVYGEYNGKSALSFINEKACDVAIIDALLPGMDGFRLVEEMRWISHCQRMPIIMMSGVYRASNHAKEAMAKYRLIDYIEKPISPEIIITLLRSIFKDKYPTPLPENLEEDNRFQIMINDHFLYDQSAMPLIGKLNEIPFPVLLNQIYERKLTGILMVAWEKIKKIITINQGKMTSISSNIVSECLGQIMVKNNFISQDVYERSFEEVKKTRRRHGEILLQMGVITSLQLSDALKMQFIEKLYSIFNWEDASFSFKPNDDPPRQHNPIENHPHVIIREGLTHHTNQKIIDKYLEPYLYSPVEPNENLKDIMQNGGFNLKEIRYLQTFDKGEKLHSAILNPLKENDEMKAFFLALASIKAIQLDQPKKPKTEEEQHKLGEIQQEASIIQAHKNIVKEGKNLENYASSNAMPSLNQEQVEKLEMMQAVQRMNTEQKAYYQILHSKRNNFREKNYFEMLGVDKDTSKEDVREVFLEMAKEFHPDTIKHTDIPEIKALADEVFTMLSKANETLTSKTKRAEYVSFLKGGGDVDATEEVAKILASEEHYHEAQVATRKQKWADAKKHLQEALKLNPDEGEYYAELGWVHFNLNPSDMVARQESIRYLEKAMDLNPKLSNAYFYLGSLYKAVGDMQNAAQWLNKTMEVDPKHQKAKSVIRLLNMRQKESKKDKDKKGFLSKLIK